MIGKTISHYKILEELGRGGMGVVYKAQDTKLKRTVALKFLPPELTRDAEAKGRFIREAQAASALEHPNICNIHEINETEDGQLFIVMACYEGKTLKQKLADSPLPVEQAVNIATWIAQGLARAHEEGIVHRDIKPANIIITHRNEVKILDFGLAKLAGQARLTKDTSTLGTVAYMSPEQVSGKEIDHRTDIWSLGVVLFEMLTGQPPFKGDYEQAIIYTILNKEPKPLIPPASGRTDLSMEVEGIVNKALAKDPDERYQHMADILVDLKLVKKEVEVGSRKQRGSTTAVTATPQKRTYLFGGIATLIILFLFALYVFFPSRSGKVDRKSIAVLPFQNMNKGEENEYFSDGITEDIITQLSKIRELRVISRTSSMRYKKTEKTLREIGEKLQVAAVLEGSVRREGDDVRITAQLIDAESDEHIWAETYDREMTHIFAIQSDVAQQIALALKAKLSPTEKQRIDRKPTENLEAYNLYLKGRYFWNKRTEMDLKKAIEHFEEAIGLDSNYGLGYAGLADSYNLLPTYSSYPGKEAYPKAKEAALKALEIDNTLSEAHNSLAWIKMMYDWDWEGAEKEFKRAIELNPGYATAHHWYALYLMRMSRFDDAMEEIRKAHELDPLSLVINRAMGNVFLGARRYGQAIDALQRTNEMDPNFSLMHFLLGKAFLLKSMYEEALAEFQKEKELSMGRWPPLDLHIGITYVLMGKRGEAQEVLDNLRERLKQTHDSPAGLAALYFALGKKDQGFEWLEKAYEEGNLKGPWRLKIDPLYDGVRSDPRFKELLKKVGLE
jgi:serine/threonine-protein kinase